MSEVRTSKTNMHSPLLVIRVTGPVLISSLLTHPCPSPPPREDGDVNPICAGGFSQQPGTGASDEGTREGAEPGVRPGPACFCSAALSPE